MGVLIAVLLVISVLMILVVLFVLRQQRRQLSALRQSIPYRLSSLAIVQLQTVSRENEQRLLRLLYGDRHKAEKLLTKERKKNPGKSENWYWEKVISQLERDRR